MKLHVRSAEPRDEKRWRELFDGYCKFYKREPNEKLNTFTWKRILDPKAQVHAIVAEADGKVIGIANYLIHEHTLGTTPAEALRPGQLPGRKSQANVLSSVRAV